MLPITYGKPLYDDYINAGQIIVNDFDQGNMCAVVEKINDSFFDGGPFAPKSFEALTSNEFPKRLSIRDCTTSEPTTIIVKEGDEISCSGFLAYLEAIPVIGTALAVINAIGHLFCMLSSYFALKKAVADLKAIERNDTTMYGTGEYSHYTDFVFHEAANYTYHQNHLYGSLLSIVPFAKPAVRLAQWALYNPPVKPSLQ